MTRPSDGKGEGGRGEGEGKVEGEMGERREDYAASSSPPHAPNLRPKDGSIGVIQLVKE